MNKGPWIGNNIDPKHKVLILGESHYDKYSEKGQPISFSTASVIEHYFVKRERWAPFFDKIAASFGYDDIEHTKDFFEQVYFGNYVDVVCGIQDGAAKQYIKENRTKCNSSLFDFINEHDIGVVVCFSKTVYNNLPSLASSSEIEGKENVGSIGQRTNWLEHCNYISGIDHAHCDVQLKSSLVVYGLRHPSSQSGYDPKQVYDFFRNQSIISDICCKYISSTKDCNPLRANVPQGERATCLLDSDVNNKASSVSEPDEEHSVTKQNSEKKKEIIDSITLGFWLSMTGNSQTNHEYLRIRKEELHGHPYEKEIVSICERMVESQNRSIQIFDYRKTKIMEAKEVLSIYCMNPAHTIGEHTIKKLREFYTHAEQDVPKEIYQDYLKQIRSDIAGEIDRVLYGFYCDRIRTEYQPGNSYHLNPEQFFVVTDMMSILSEIYDVVSENVDCEDGNLIVMYNHMIDLRKNLLNVSSYTSKKTAFEIEWTPQDTLSNKDKKTLCNDIAAIRKRINLIQKTCWDGVVESEIPQVERLYIVPDKDEDIEQFKEESEKRIVSEFQAIISLYTQDPTRDNAKVVSHQMDEYYECAWNGARHSIFEYYYTEIRNSMADTVERGIMTFWKNRALTEFEAEDGTHHTIDQLRVFLDRVECCRAILAKAIHNTEEMDNRNISRYQHLIDILSAALDAVAYEKSDGFFGRLKWIPSKELSAGKRYEYEKDVYNAKKKIALLKGESFAEEKPQKRETPSRAIKKDVAGVAVAYAAQKAVTSKKKESPYAKNPYAGRYAEAQKKATENRTAARQTATKQRVKLSNGRDALLHTMPNGSQQLVDMGGRIIARYDCLYDRTTEGNLNVVGKGNLISRYLS